LGLLELVTGDETRPDHLAILPDAYGRAAEEILPHGPIYIGLAPGAGRMDTGKCWPLENFMAVANQQKACGRTPVVFLGPLEQDWRNKIKEAVPGALFSPLEWRLESGDVVSGPTLTTALGSRLGVSVANCSGTGHMLAAGGSKMVSLYGPTDPDKFGPYTPYLMTIQAQDFGAGIIYAIPVQAVLDAIDQSLAEQR
jgi:ADP-heptose:LPS heptosyltransferase